ncbi:YbhB/YbcL family Raf kinase inhibitor-like protein [Streptomyces canus]|uniref:YbhB/YbcL family Raf kinase inhibitor-like protein n=1 Tax=Streptomyces canus TaxID=58343 RepID=UPI0033B35E53
MRKSVRNLAVLGAAATVVAGVTAVATADTGSGRTSTTQRDTFGHTKVRSGIPAGATRFTVTSPDVRDGGAIPATSFANTFGCTGENQQLRLQWSGAPKNTRSFAVSMQDVDAPTGSGFWHWTTWDIPAGEKSLGRTLPAGAVTGTNDSGASGYMGPCPPAGDITHRYKITVYALDTPSLGLPTTSTPAVAAFTRSSHILGYGRITATARR